MLTTIIDQMEGNCFCLLGEFVIPGVRTSMKLFGAEYEALAVAEEEVVQPERNLIHTFFS
jgi:NADH:ubiquinone oxidoreductase subunit F (NADH-binding)